MSVISEKEGKQRYSYGGLLAQFASLDKEAINNYGRGAKGFASDFSVFREKYMEVGLDHGLETTYCPSCGMKIRVYEHKQGLRNMKNVLKSYLV